MFFAVVLIAAVGRDIYESGARLHEHDFMLTSGLVALILGMLGARTMPGRLANTVLRLQNRSVIPEGIHAPDLIAELTTVGGKRGRIAAPLVGILVLIGWLITTRLHPSGYQVYLICIEVIGGVIAGYYLGRMTAYGRLGRMLAHRGVTVRAIPGHPDGAAGLKPVGNLYLFQALLAAIPAIYLVAWIILIPIWPNDYSRWEKWFLFGLLPLAIVFEILAFLVPMWEFHRQMKAQKIALLKEVDRLAPTIGELQRALLASKGSAEAEVLRKRFESVVEVVREREDMPTWPIDQGIRKRFTLSNGVLVFLPLASKVFRIPEAIQAMIAKLGETG